MTSSTKRQRTSGGGVVGVDDAARTVRAVDHLVVADDRAAHELERRELRRGRHPRARRSARVLRTCHLPWPRRASRRRPRRRRYRAGGRPGSSAPRRDVRDSARRAARPAAATAWRRDGEDVATTAERRRRLGPRPSAGRGRRRRRPFRAPGSWSCSSCAAAGRRPRPVGQRPDPAHGRRGPGRRGSPDARARRRVGQPRRPVRARSRTSSTTGRDEGGLRTDTIFVMTIQGGRVALLAFPRDLWVTRCDGSTGRINAAQELGGPSCLVATVRELSGIDVQPPRHRQLRRLPRRGRRGGGVEVCLDEPIADRDAGIDLPAGCQNLEGARRARLRPRAQDRRRPPAHPAAADLPAGPRLRDRGAVDAVQPLPRSVPAHQRDRRRHHRRPARSAPIDLVRLALGARGLAGGGGGHRDGPEHRGHGRARRPCCSSTRPQRHRCSARSPTGRSSTGRARAGPASNRSDVTVRVLNGAGVAGSRGAGRRAARGSRLPDRRGRQHRRARHLRGPAPRAERAGAELVASDLGGLALEESTEVTQVTVVVGRDRAALG